MDMMHYKELDILKEIFHILKYLEIKGVLKRNANPQLFSHTLPRVRVCFILFVCFLLP